jgi:hypothetical protein
MGNVIPLRADAFKPMAFDMSPDKARSAHADAAMATMLLIWAQITRETALRGEMTAPQRLLLLEAVAAVSDHPRLT